MEAKPLIVIVGPTASGKTALAIELAKQFNGEIICADSRTVYRRMDIGTAKPTKKEQSEVPHWGIDIVNPDQRFTAADFKAYAEQKIIEIRSRGHVPFLVGGSGLYVDAVIFDYKFGDIADVDFRRKLNSMTVDELQNYCNINNIPLPENYKNQRYLVRTIELNGVRPKRENHPIDNIIVVGISTDKIKLRKKIEQRATEMIQGGVIDEAKKLAETYGWNDEAMSGNVYPLCRSYLENELSIDELRQKFVVQDWRLVKRQLTWFRRNEFIKWLSVDEAKKYIVSLLDSEH